MSRLIQRLLIKVTDFIPAGIVHGRYKPCAIRNIDAALT